MLFFLLLLTFINCSESIINKEITGGDKEKEMVKVPIKLSVKPMKIVGERNTEPVQRIAHTRTGDWGDNADEVDEDKIQNLWVLQFKSDGDFLYKDYYADVDKMNFASDLTTADNCTLAFVANMGPSAYTTVPANLTEFKKGVGYHEMIAQIKSNKVLPMVGIKDEVDVPSGVNGGLQVEMKRAVARLDFTYSFSPEMQTVISAGNLGMDQIIVKNIPAKVTYDLSEDSPATSELINITERNIGFASKDGATLYVYLPHNARGANSSITDPSDKVDKPYATYVSLLTYRTNMTTDLLNDGIEYLTYLGANNTTDFNVNANTKYNITSTIKGALQGDKRVVYRESTSNCYMIPKYMGSSGTTANSTLSVLIPVRRANMSKHIGKQLNDVSTGWTAEVLWRDNSGTSITIAQDSPYKEHGCFKVTVSDPKGNAIIAIKDGSNNILWSWHIWMPEYSDAKTSYILHNGHKFMTNLLGAYNFNDTANPTDQWYYPCYFQWGRKDPVPGCNGTDDGTFREIYSGASGSTTTTVTGEGWDTTMLTGGDPTNTMRYATRNPKKLIGSANSVTYDWFTNTLGKMDPYLWRTENGEKTVNDPCPMGWRVAYAKGTSKTESDWDTSQISTDGIGGTGTFYYPKPGYLYYNANVTNKIGISLTRTEGMYWQNYIILPITDSVNYLDLATSSSIKESYRYRGYAIHCVKIE